jgi:hypothetical protein
MQEWEGNGRTSMLLPCSRNARPQKGLLRRPQLEHHACPPPILGEGKLARAVKDIGPPLFNTGGKE